MARLLLEPAPFRAHVPSNLSAATLAFQNYPVLLHEVCMGAKGRYAIAVVSHCKGLVIWLNGQYQVVRSAFAEDLPQMASGLTVAQQLAFLPVGTTARPHGLADIRVQPRTVHYTWPIRSFSDLCIGAHFVEQTPTDPTYAGVAISRLGVVKGKQCNQNGQPPVNSPLDICVWGVKRGASIIGQPIHADLLSHRDVFVEVETFRRKNAPQVSAFRSALDAVSRATDPSQIRTTFMVGALSLDFVLKWYKWIGMQEDVNYPTTSRCRGRLKPLDCIEMVLRGTAVADLPRHCC